MLDQHARKLTGEQLRNAEKQRCLPNVVHILPFEEGIPHHLIVMPLAGLTLPKAMMFPAISKCWTEK